ncbi:hypothetical protein VTG60DRAFT_1302 [Thermothelomyces hinnuleus]
MERGPTQLGTPIDNPYSVHTYLRDVCDPPTPPPFSSSFHTLSASRLWMSFPVMAMAYVQPSTPAPDFTASATSSQGLPGPKSNKVWPTKPATLNWQLRGGFCLVMSNWRRRVSHSDNLSSGLACQVRVTLLTVLRRRRVLGVPLPRRRSNTRQPSMHCYSVGVSFAGQDRNRGCRRQFLCAHETGCRVEIVLASGPLALIARHAITLILRCIQQAGNDSRCILVSRTVVQYRTVLLGKVLRIQHFTPSKPRLDDRAFFEPRVELEGTWLGCSFGSVPRGQ